MLSRNPYPVAIANTASINKTNEVAKITPKIADNVVLSAVLFILGEAFSNFVFILAPYLHSIAMRVGDLTLYFGHVTPGQSSVRKGEAGSPALL